jgi:16S rRNA (adenine1518-N6/adenine1519-N6)-dimethyltransferase
LLTPKKHLGQHFLTDQNIARNITKAIGNKDLPLLEIGPGMGILTRYLLADFPANFYVVEIDRAAIAYLRQEIPELGNSLIEGDFLKVDLQKHFPGKFNIIGNFPYNISSQILFRVLDLRTQVDEVVCMLQKEVAVRIASPPGSRDYGIMSVLLQAFYDIEYLFMVNETVFSPPPKVKSAVIRLKRNTTEHLACDEKLFFRTVKTAFNQRRKTLRNALKSMTPEGTELPEQYRQLRAERLSVEDFVALTQAIIV